jgi:hypothetical protein
MESTLAAKKLAKHKWEKARRAGFTIDKKTGKKVYKHAYYKQLYKSQAKGLKTINANRLRKVHSEKDAKERATENKRADKVEKDLAKTGKIRKKKAPKLSRAEQRRRDEYEASTGKRFGQRTPAPF